MNLRLGVLVKALRSRKGWSQEEFAEKLHMSRSAISKLESDKQTLDVPTLVQMIQVAGAPEIAAAILFGMDGIAVLPTIMQMIGG